MQASLHEQHHNILLDHTRTSRRRRVGVGSDAFGPGGEPGGDPGGCITPIKGVGSQSYHPDRGGGCEATQHLCASRASGCRRHNEGRPKDFVAGSCGTVVDPRCLPTASHAAVDLWLAGEMG
jgi:hypothetical protein